MPLLSMDAPLVRRSSLFIFACLCLLAYGFAVAGQMFFPTPRMEVQLGRIALTLVGVAILWAGSRWLLQRDGFSADALGLRLSLQHGKGFLLGILAGVCLMALITATLWIVMPFHFEAGGLAMTSLGLSPLADWGANFAEELIFRGYALLV